MQNQNGESWRNLCEQAAVEQDPQRLLALVDEIDKLLRKKEPVLHQADANHKAA